MTGFTNIESIRVPTGCINEVYRHLRAAGKQGLEAVALWSGKLREDGFEVLSTIIPVQFADRVEDGLFYAVDGEELHRINTWLYINDETLIAQLHSHPGEAYHSEVDDLFPIVAIIGGLSIVIPEFAFHTPSITEWAVYRLNPQQTWDLLAPSTVKQLIQIIS